MSGSLAVILGSAVGGLARYWLTILVAALAGPRLPWGTLLINVLGSFVIGWFGALTGAGGRIAVPPEMRAFVLVGVCGGFTTFSSFSLQTLELVQAEEFGVGRGLCRRVGGAEPAGRMGRLSRRPVSYTSQQNDEVPFHVSATLGEIEEHFHVEALVRPLLEDGRGSCRRGGAVRLRGLSGLWPAIRLLLSPCALLLLSR